MSSQTKALYHVSNVPVNTNDCLDMTVGPTVYGVVTLSIAISGNCRLHQKTVGIGFL